MQNIKQFVKFYFYLILIINFTINLSASECLDRNALNIDLKSRFENFEKLNYSINEIGEKKYLVKATYKKKSFSRKFDYNNQNCMEAHLYMARIFEHHFLEKTKLANSYHWQLGGGILLATEDQWIKVNAAKNLLSTFANTVDHFLGVELALAKTKNFNGGQISVGELNLNYEFQKKKTTSLPTLSFKLNGGIRQVSGIGYKRNITTYLPKLSVDGGVYIFIKKRLSLRPSIIIDVTRLSTVLTNSTTGIDLENKYSRLKVGLDLILFTNEKF